MRGRMRYMTICLIAGATALSVVGCGSSGSKSDAAASSGTSTDATSGCSGGSLPSTITVGVSMPLSGPVAPTGIDTRDGIQYAAQYIEQKLLPGHTIKVDVIDDKFDTQQVAVNMQHLISEHVNAIVGPLGTSANAALPLAQKAGVLTLAIKTPEPELVKIGPLIYFTTADVDTDGPQSLAEALSKAGIKPQKAVIAVDRNYASDSQFVDAIKPLLEKEGVQFGKEVDYPEGATNYGAQVSAVTSQQPDLVIAGGNTPYIGVFLKQLKEAGYKGVIAGSLQTAVVTFQKAIGSAANGIIGLGYWVPNSPGQTPLSKQFTAEYQKDNNGKLPSSYFGIGADSMLALGYALKNCPSVKASDMAASLLSMPPFDGVQGSGLTYAKVNRTLKLKPTTYIWVNGQLVPLTAANAPKS